MARNGSGTMSIPNTFVSGATITASGHNQNYADIVSELTNSVAADGQTSLTGPIKAANGTAAAPSVSFASDTDTGMYRHGANELGFAVNGTLAGWFDSALKLWLPGALNVVGTFSLNGVAAFPVPTAQIADKAVTLSKLYHPSAASRLLGTNANAALTITGAAASAGLIRLTMASTATFTTGQSKTVSDVTGTTEANGTWTITVVDATHIDLQGSTFANAYVSGGTIGGGVDEVKLGTGLVMTGDTINALIGPTLVPNYLSGLTMSTAGSSGTMSIVAGVANDSTNAVLMSLAAIAKTTASWVVGTGNGGLDTGAIANSTWYYFYVIERVDTGVTDVLFSLNATGPSSLPTNYTLWRRIGAGKTDGSAKWVAFTQTGDEFMLVTPVLDVNTTITTSGSSITLASAPALTIQAIINFGIQNASVGIGVYLSPTAESDLAPSNTAAPGCTLRTQVASVMIWQGNFYMRLASGGFRARAEAASTTFNVATLGWVDTRGK